MTLLLTVLLATAFMAGPSWFISVVHYPLFAWVEEAEWKAYHAPRSRCPTTSGWAPASSRRSAGRLVLGHHLRTVLWSAHAVLLCTMVAAA